MVSKDDLEFEWAYYLVGSTGSAILWAVLTSLALVFVVELLRHKQKKDLNKIGKKGFGLFSTYNTSH